MLTLPSQECLLEKFEYIPSTGKLLYKKHRSDKYIGKPVVSKGNRYLKVRVNGIRYRAHRLIWMMMTGEDPGELFIDHINQDKRDNRWSNLRLATKVQNGANISFTIGQQSRWGFIVRCTFEGRRIYVGTFKTQEEAQKAYNIKKHELHGEYAPA